MKLPISQSRIVGLIYVILITLLIALLYDNTSNATEPRGNEQEQCEGMCGVSYEPTASKCEK
jgi:hypothetical protein